MPQKLQPWIVARKRHRLSHAHVQMARELEMNPKTLGKLDNHDQEPWKLPLPQYIEHLYEKRFGRTRPEVVMSIEERANVDAKKRAARKERKAQRHAELASETEPAKVELSSAPQPRGALPPPTTARRGRPSEPRRAARSSPGSVLHKRPRRWHASAVVSLGKLRLTTAPSWSVDDRYGCVGLWSRGEKVAIALIPAGVHRATEQSLCTPSDARIRISIWMQRLLSGYSLHPLDAGDCEDPTSPAFDLHQQVRVCSCGGRNTERHGVIREVIWHSKHRRWNYYLQVGDKALSKRYYSVDLVPDSD